MKQRSLYDGGADKPERPSVAPDGTGAVSDLSTPILALAEPAVMASNIRRSN